MGLEPSGMQPFELDGSRVVCNGEIYGFEKIKAELSTKYNFKSGSDCEVLLPLWKEYGTDMFKMLDAEFALVLYDGDTHEFVAARDPIGIRPLFYGYGAGGSIVFASEAKNLVGLVEKVTPFPPGCFWRGGEFTRYADPGRGQGSDGRHGGRGLRGHTRAARQGRGETPRLGREGGLPPERRAGLLSRLRHSGAPDGKKDTHLRHRHERRRHPTSATPAR